MQLPAGSISLTSEPGTIRLCTEGDAVLDPRQARAVARALDRAITHAIATDTRAQ
jgi:hypothetical protein